MINHDSDYIDQLLQGKTEAKEHDMLHIDLINAAAQPHPEFVRKLENQLSVHTKSKNPRKRHLKVLHSFRLLLAAGLSLFLVVGVVLAIDSLFQRIINEDPGLSAVMESGLGTGLGLTQTVDDFTVEIPWVYADSHRLSVGYLIRANDLENYTNLQISELTLTDSSRHVYPINSQGLMLIENNQAAGQLHVNLSQIRNLADELDLLLTFRVGYITEARRTAIPQPAKPEGFFLLSGEFRFEFTLPVIEGYLLQTNLSTESAGIPMRLQEFMAAPSGGYAIVCYPIPEHPADERWEWDVGHSVISFEDNLIAQSHGGRRNPETGCSQIRFNDPMPLAEGVWMINIEGIIGIRTHLPDSETFVATVEAAGGVLLKMDDTLMGMELPEGAMQAIGMREDIHGQWVYRVAIPPSE